MDNLDDLLIKRRRGALRAAEEQRLRFAVRSSREYELALLAGDVFERDGAPHSGDAEQLERLIEATERRWFTASPARWRLPRALRPLAVVPMLLAGAAAAAYGGYRAFESTPAGAKPPAAEIASSSPRRAPPLETLAALEPPSIPSPSPKAAPDPIPPPPNPIPTPSPIPAMPGPNPANPISTAPIPSAAPSPTSAHPHARTRARTSSSRASNPPPRDALPSTLPPLATVAVDPSDTSNASGSSSATDASETAQSLFERANRLRRDDWSAAADVYRRLVERHPSSTEAGIAEVALGKWALSQGRSGDALEWFRAHQRRSDSALMAEALWGEAQALETLASHAEARAPWRRLLELYPNSPYAAAARARLER